MPNLLSLEQAHNRPHDRYDAVLITDTNIHPTIPADSVVFLSEPGFRWDGLYAIHREGEFAGVYRVYRSTRGISFSLDNWPGNHVQDVPVDHLPSMNIRQVAGVAMPYMPEFARFLVDRFLGREGEP